MWAKFFGKTQLSPPPPRPPQKKPFIFNIYFKSYFLVNFTKIPKSFQLQV